jgi:acetyltransferase-like isoleucine patch superfamily enzyme
MLSKLFSFFLKLLYRSGSYFRGVRLYIAINLAGGKCRGVPRVGKGVSLKYPPHAGYDIGRGLDLGPGCVFDVPPSGKLFVGDNVKMTAGVVVSAVESVSIGSDCLIAEWVSIRDAQHFYSGERLIREQSLDISNIVIESDVWIGRSSAVLLGSYLEQGCVLGAHSLVKGKRLSGYALYVGTPAKKAKDRVVK